MKSVYAIVLSAVFAGCANPNWNGGIDTSSLRADKITSSKRIAGAKDHRGAEIEIEYERPVDPALASFVDRHVAKSYENACGEPIDGTGMGAVEEAFGKSYGKSAKNAEWQLKYTGTFFWFNSTFATYRTSVFTYFGGAHPTVWYGNATYDRRTGRRIAVADMFDETNVVPVVNVIRRKIAADETRSDLLREKCSNDVSGAAADYLGTCDGSEPKVTENFMIVEQGLIWTYNEYEISSYSEGTTDVFVSWDDIGKYLKESAPTRSTPPVGGWDAAIEAAQRNGNLRRIADLIFFAK
jgi:hypothetical protein